MLEVVTLQHHHSLIFIFFHMQNAIDDHLYKTDTSSILVLFQKLKKKLHTLVPHVIYSFACNKVIVSLK